MLSLCERLHVYACMQVTTSEEGGLSLLVFLLTLGSCISAPTVHVQFSLFFVYLRNRMAVVVPGGFPGDSSGTGADGRARKLTL